MKAWLHAFRLRTLPLAVSSIIVGSALAWMVQGHSAVPRPHVWITCLALLTAVLLQVLSNLANDLGDHQHGTDGAGRIGPMRAVQSGTISEVAMQRAMIWCGVLALISGCALILLALGPGMWALVFLGVGVTAILAAVKYTFGSRPYGYAGWGDLSVFLFFGIAGVCGTYYLHVLRSPLTVWSPAVAFGLLSTAVLNLNNMRDVVNDAANGKVTLVVRMGRPLARIYHLVLVVGGLILLVHHTATNDLSVHKWLYLLVVPMYVWHLLKVLRHTDPKTLDPQLGMLAMSTFLTAMLFSLGIFAAA